LGEPEDVAVPVVVPAVPGDNAGRLVEDEGYVGDSGTGYVPTGPRFADDVGQELNLGRQE
jgi:hypothetical protein